MNVRALLSALVSVCLLQIAQAQNTTKWTPDTTFKVKRVGPVVPSPEGTRIAFVVGEALMEGDKSEWISQIHIASADGSGSFQLTRGDKSSTNPQWSPDGEWIAFTSSRGDTKSNLFRIRLAGGEAEQVTSEKGSVGAFEWAPDGKSIAFSMAEPKTDAEDKAAKEKRDARVVDENEKRNALYVISVEKNADGKRPSTRLTGAEMHVTGFDWAPDSKTIVFSHARNTKVFQPNDISTVSATGGASTVLVATPGDESNPLYSPDGRSLAYTAGDDPQTWALTTAVRVVPASGGTSRALAKTFDEQPSVAGWTADGRGLYITETHGTIGRLSLLPIDGGAPVPISGQDFSVSGIVLNRTATAAGLVTQRADKAPEPYVTRISDAKSFAPKQVASVQTLPSVTAKTEVIRWKSTDGLDVEGLLTYPTGYERGRKTPLLVIVHGGPTGVFTQSYIGSPGPYPIAVFVDRGYAVLRVNPRGSSGYGRKFRYANYQDWGGGDYKDIMTGVDHVISMGVADPDRLGIMGWSYGGYMTSWVITQTKRFRAASVGAGVTNLMSFTGTADIPGFVPDYFGGEFWDVFDRWRSHSAMFNIKGVTTPTLIQHGEQDLRVPISQGYELYNALVRQKVETKMVVYPRQPHGIQEPKLVKDAMERNLEWFDRWIKPGSTTTTSENNR
jgi:dipeptidyl aminopeptidase/acylaminoacyl peptidase